MDPDLKTLHTLSRIRQLNDHARVFVEMADPKSEMLAHLGDNVTVISSRELLESVLKHQAFNLSAYFPPASAS